MPNGSAKRGDEPSPPRWDLNSTNNIGSFCADAWHFLSGKCDPNWTALIFAPRHQEYPSAHSIATGAFMRVLERSLGDEHSFVLSSPGFPAFTWTFDRFSDAAAQVKQARVWAGIHYPNSTEVGGAMGLLVGDYLVDHALRPLGGDDED